MGRTPQGERGEDAASGRWRESAVQGEERAPEVQMPRWSAGRRAPSRGGGAAPQGANFRCALRRSTPSGFAGGGRKARPAASQK